MGLFNRRNIPLVISSDGTWSVPFKALLSRRNYYQECYDSDLFDIWDSNIGEFGFVSGVIEVHFLGIKCNFVIVLFRFSLLGN